MSYTYEYPRPALTVDCVVFGYDLERLKVLLIERGLEPFAGSWALPGGFVDMNEDLEMAARRELEEETGVSSIFLEQLYTFGNPGRDPRGRVVSVAYYALVNTNDHDPVASTDARRAVWHCADDPPPMAFDHAGILDVALRRLRAKIRYEPIGFELLPKQFTLTQLQHLYEGILGKELDKRNFRKKILSMGLLKDLKRMQSGVGHRPARLYAFNRSRYEALRVKGFNFDL